ncbi:MAG: alpha/beta hydrolase [Candidatus Margulisiibacteriota bacterium]
MRVSSKLYQLRGIVAKGQLLGESRKTVLCSGLPAQFHEQIGKAAHGRLFSTKEEVTGRQYEHLIGVSESRKPLVVMLPDDMLGSFAYRLVALQLQAAGYTVILPNYRCQFLSQESELQGKSSLDQYVSNVQGALFPGKVVLIGHGRGGSVARALIKQNDLNRCEIVGAMFICDPNLVGLSRVRIDAGLMWSRFCGSFSGEISLGEATARRSFFSDQIEKDDFVENVFPYMTPLFAKGSNEAIEMGPDDLTIPWRAVFGRKDKSLILSGIEHQNVTYIDNGSHIPMITQPEETAKIILEFLNQF